MIVFWLPLMFVLSTMRLANYMKQRWPNQDAIDWVHDSYWGRIPVFVRRAPLPKATARYRRETR
jgi:hypothetical protein